MAGQWMVPPALRERRLIVIDQELVERVLAELPAGVLSELRAEFPGAEDALEQEECLPTALLRTSSSRSIVT